MKWTIPRWWELRRVVADLRESLDYLRDRCLSHHEKISETRLTMLAHIDAFHTRLDGTVPVLSNRIDLIEADIHRVDYRVAALESTVAEEFRKLAKLIEERTPPIPGIPAGEWPYPPPPDDSGSVRTNQTGWPLTGMSRPDDPHMTALDVHDRAKEIAEQYALRKVMAQAVIVRVDDDPESLEITRDQWASLKTLFRERP